MEDPTSPTTAINNSLKRKRSQEPEENQQLAPSTTNNAFSTTPTVNSTMNDNGNNNNNNNNNNDAKEDSSTFLTSQQTLRLFQAMEMIDAHGVLDHSADSAPSLRAILTIPGEKPPEASLVLDAINNALNALYESNKQDYSILQDLHNFARVFVPAVSALCPENKSNTNKNSNADAKLAAPRSRYVLHRVLANGVDIFTSPAPGELSQETINELDTLRDTDLLAIHDSTRPPVQVSTLDPLSRPVKALKPYPPIYNPSVTSTATLYYDPFSSFAPAYDSTGANEPYTRTMTRRNAQRAIRNWSARINASLQEPIDPQLDSSNSNNTTNGTSSISNGNDAEQTRTTTTTTDITVTTNGEDKHQQDNNDSDKDKDRHDDHDQDLNLDTQLELGAKILRKLQLKQWQRLRLDPMIPKYDDHQKDVDVPDESERDLANKLLNHLCKCLPLSSSSQQRHENKNKFSLIPRPQDLHDLRHRIIQPKQPAYQGILEPINGKGVKESTLNAPPPQAPQTTRK